MFWNIGLDIAYGLLLVHAYCCKKMTPSASPYAVFKAEEWVSAVAQPIGIGQCLRLTPKKLAPIRSSVKKKSGNSLRKRFSKKHVQLAFAWHVNISIIPAKIIAEQFFRFMFIIVLFFMDTFWFHVVFFGCANERKRLFVVQRWSDTLNRSIILYCSHAIFDQHMSSISFID